MTETEGAIFTRSTTQGESIEDRYRAETRAIVNYCRQFREPGYSDFILGRTDVPKDKQYAYDRMDQTTRAAILAYTSLPDEPEERVRLLKAARRAIDGRFSDSSLVLADYMRNPADTRKAWGEDWRDTIKYDPTRVEISNEIQEAMDNINFYLKMRQGVNPGLAIDTALKQAARTGLITEEQAKTLKLGLIDALDDAHFRETIDNLGAERVQMISVYKGDDEYGTGEGGEQKEDTSNAQEKPIGKRKYIERNGQITKRKKRNRNAILSSKEAREDRWQSGTDRNSFSRQEVINNIKLRNSQ